MEQKNEEVFSFEKELLYATITRFHEELLTKLLEQLQKGIASELARHKEMDPVILLKDEIGRSSTTSFRRKNKVEPLTKENLGLLSTSQKEWLSKIRSKKADFVVDTTKSTEWN